MKKLLTYTILCCSCLTLQAQTALDMLRAGNKQFMAEEFDEAEKSYQKALEIDDSYSFAMFNLGNTFFVNEDFEQAQSQFENAARTATHKIEKSNAYYNLGSNYVSTAIRLAKEAQENPGGENDDDGDPFSYLKKGAEAYKDALRNNPMDEDARYNLAYIQNLLKQQPPQSDQDQENQDENQDGEKKEDNQEQQEPKDGEGDEEKEDGEDGDDKKEQPKPKELSKEEAKRLLEAIDKQEKDIREKMNLKKTKGERIKIEKDW